MQIRLVGAPLPAVVATTLDIGERIELLEPRRPLCIPPIREVPVPQMSDSPRYVAHGTAHAVREGSRPRAVMLGAARIHTVRDDGIAGSPQGPARVRLVA